MSLQQHVQFHIQNEGGDATPVFDFGHLLVFSDVRKVEDDEFREIVEHLIDRQRAFIFEQLVRLKLQRELT